MAKLNKLAEATIFRKVLKIRNIDLPVHCPALASTCVVLQNMIRTQRPKKITSFPAIFRLSLIFLEYKLVVNLGLGWAGLGWAGLGWPDGARWGSLGELLGGCCLEECLLKVHCEVVLYTMCRNHNYMLIKGGT